MPIIPLEQINQFLPLDKLELNTTIDTDTDEPVDYPLVKELSVTARDIIKGKLSDRYLTTTWFATSTPSIIMNIAGMLVAGWVYNRQYAEESSDGSSYGTLLITTAYDKLEAILHGMLVVEDADFNKDVINLTASVEQTEPFFTMSDRL